MGVGASGNSHAQAPQTPEARSPKLHGAMNTKHHSYRTVAGLANHSESGALRVSGNTTRRQSAFQPEQKTATLRLPTSSRSGSLGHRVRIPVRFLVSAWFVALSRQRAATPPSVGDNARRVRAGWSCYSFVAAVVILWMALQSECHAANYAGTHISSVARSPITLGQRLDIDVTVRNDGDLPWDGFFVPGLIVVDFGYSWAGTPPAIQEEFFSPVYPGRSRVYRVGILP